MSAPAPTPFAFPITKSDLRCHANEDSPSAFPLPLFPSLFLSLSAEIIQRCQHFGVNVGPQKSYWILHRGRAADNLTWLTVGRWWMSSRAAPRATLFSLFEGDLPMNDVVGYFTLLFIDRPRDSQRRLTTNNRDKCVILLSFLCDFHDFVLMSRPIWKRSKEPFLPRPPPPLPTP